LQAKHKLVIVESPAKAKSVARFLGRSYKVTASQGHVRDLPKSQFGIDPDNNYAMKYITIRGRGDILAELRKQVKGASKVLLATDPDREGEAISWHLAQALGLDVEAPIRIEFNEITKPAVQAAVKAARTIDMNRVDAQQARRALDRIVGYKISPLLWAKVKKGLSAGRVQSVAVRMVADREQEIDAFIPEEYWEISAGIETSGKKLKEPLRARLAAISGKKADIRDKKGADKAVKLIKEGTFSITSVKKKQRRKNPAPPFTTSTMQQEASRKLNFTSARTMQVVQGLYEGVDLGAEGTQGLVTYIRTDAVRVSEQALAAVREQIKSDWGEAYLPKTAKVYKSGKRAQDAHEAIRPTDMSRTPDKIKDKLTREQWQLYRLIYNRFMASQMNEALFDTVTAEIEGNGVGLRYYGEHKVFAGFTALYEEGSDDEETQKSVVLPEFKEGAAVKILDVEALQRFTQPPARYTEASLIQAMEEKGIGRPSTYAPTISTIVGRGYVSRENKRLYPTELGKMVNDIMMEYFEPIMDLDFTAEMEDRLDAVEEGKEPWTQVLAGFYPDFINMVEKAESTLEKIDIPDEVSDIPCDECGAMMVYKMGRYGRFLACPRFPECRHTKPIITYIKAPCPTCGARLQQKTTRKGRRFYGCERYPECDFTSWELVDEKACPRCDSYMTVKNKKTGALRLCSNPNCRYHEPIEEEREA
jgi:DNA topoisomerase-1